jgi:hypothetical protein
MKLEARRDLLKALMEKRGGWRYDPKDPDVLHGACPNCSPEPPVFGQFVLFVRFYGGVASVNCCAGCSPREVARGLRRAAREVVAPDELFAAEVELTHFERTGHYGRPSCDRRAA